MQPHGSLKPLQRLVCIAPLGVNAAITRCPKIANASADLLQRGLRVCMTSQLVVGHGQAKLRILVLIVVRFTARARRLKVTEQVITEPDICFKRTLIWLKGLGLL